MLKHNYQIRRWGRPMERGGEPHDLRLSVQERNGRRRRDRQGAGNEVVCRVANVIRRRNGLHFGNGLLTSLRTDLLGWMVLGLPRRLTAAAWFLRSFRFLKLAPEAGRIGTAGTIAAGGRKQDAPAERFDAAIRATALQMRHTGEQRRNRRRPNPYRPGDRTEPDHACIIEWIHKVGQSSHFVWFARLPIVREPRRCTQPGSFK